MKSQFQDIIPPEKRSIRNIALKNEQKETVEQESAHALPKNTNFGDSSNLWISHSGRESINYHESPRQGGSLRRFFVWSFSIISVCALFFVVSWFLSGATVLVEAKRYTINLPQTINLTKKQDGNSVLYSTIDINQTNNTLVSSTDTKDVTEKAEGDLIIYNNFSTASQKLVEGTRFETSKGLIYKLSKTITVPGKTAGKDVPGSIQAHVIAEKAGPDYNITPSDFTIPGFKGTPKFTGFFARSKSNFTGGFIGKIPVIDSVTFQATVDNLKERMKKELIEKAERGIPDSKLPLENLAIITFSTSTPKADLGQNKARVEVQGKISLILIDVPSLTQTLLNTIGTAYDNKSHYIIESTSKATFTSKQSDSNQTTLDATGEITIRQDINIENFKSEILGKTAKEIEQIVIKSHPEIARITTTIRPFWRFSLPKDTTRVIIKTN